MGRGPAWRARSCLGPSWVRGEGLLEPSRYMPGVQREDLGPRSAWPSLPAPTSRTSAGGQPAAWPALEAAQVLAALRTAPGINACGQPRQEQMGSPMPCWPLCCRPVFAKPSPGTWAPPGPCCFLSSRCAASPGGQAPLPPVSRPAEAPLPWSGVHTPELHGNIPPPAPHMRLSQETVQAGGWAGRWCLQLPGAGSATFWPVS